MTSRAALEVPVRGGVLGGWIQGDGPPVLLLHGGPGLSYEYLDDLASDVGEGFRVAAYQQRGLEPSTLDGPFTVAQAVDDAVAILEALDWSEALVVGHSWGGHLALRLLAAHPERIHGVLAVDPHGIAGDGGMAAFEAEMAARTPKAAREHAQMLDERAMAGTGTVAEGLEAMEIFWPAYFADPENPPPMPPLRMSVEAYSGIISQVSEGIDAVAAALAQTDVPYGIVAGAASPMPWGQSARAAAELSSRAFLTVVPGAGHFTWHESPGSVRAGLLRLSRP